MAGKGSAILDERQRLIDLCKQRVAQGASRDEILDYLHDVKGESDKGFPNTISSLIIVERVFDIGLKDALRCLRENNSWRDEAGKVLS